jgi:hypothetical protein
MPKARAVERSKTALFVLSLLMYGLNSSCSFDPTTVALEAVHFHVLPPRNFIFRCYDVLLHTTVCFLAESYGSAVLRKKEVY